MSADPFAISSGHHLPTGAHADARGVNFSIFARDAVAVELRLYTSGTSPAPLQVIGLDPETNRTFHFWHVQVRGLPAGVHYTWRIARAGQQLASQPELLDPWARALGTARWDRRRARAGDIAGNALRAIVPAPDASAAPVAPRALRSLADAVIYELHVGGFTRHHSSGVVHPGTFAGLVEKIPYLRALGVTHVELMPVMAFDEQDVPEPVGARGHRNYWGYSTCAFYAPHPRYCIDPAHAPHEFRACVRALHEAGIGVLLDVVFNHTAEGGADGPVIHFKALSGDIFYHRDPDGRFRDYTGCGNTVNCNHPLVTTYIVNCLEYWAEEMGVDGFRFDLASVFARGLDGEVLADPPLPWAIELARPLLDRPLIAEAWDAVGLYHVGAFPGMRWAEWNGRYRDTVRRFVRGETALAGDVATLLAGSSDLYADDNRPPASGINFVTCHDGFTLADLVSFERKHNEDNGEDNRDGSDQNLGWNCGFEGASADAAIDALRARQARNFMAILLLSQGVPMILAGDEVLRTQHGNNNAWCQDNAVSWFDWSLVEKNAAMLRFVREAIALRKRHPSLRRRRFLSGKPAAGTQLADISWHGERLGAPPWIDAGAQVLAFTLAGTQPAEGPLHVVLNMSEAARAVEVPRIAGLAWRLALDTALDIGAVALQAVVGEETYPVQARSVVVLESEIVPPLPPPGRAL